MPPPGTGAVIRNLQLRFHPVDESLIDPQTYLYYIQTQPSRSSDGVWVTYDEAAEQKLRDDFRRLWGTNFLDNLWVEVIDEPYDNGVLGKRVIFNMEERPRVKIVDYTGSSKVERTKIDEKMKEAGVALRLDSFLDEGAVRRVKGIIQEMMGEKGYQFAEINSTVEVLPGGPKLVKVVFDVQEGPKVRIREVDFVGNTALGDGTLRRKMKETKQHGAFSWLTGGGTFKEAKFEEDADMVVAHYRNEGYIEARVGAPELKTLQDSTDGKTRWIQVRIPVTEGARFKVGQFDFNGNTVVKGEALRTLFKLQTGDWYSEKRVRDGLRKAQEVYGGGGYFEFTGYPDLKPQPAPEGPIAGSAEPTVDVTMQMQEGEQYFVNRITFVGNTTTRDTVVRREMRLVEGNIFNTEALKYSVRRLNQVGYFKTLEEGQGIDVKKTPNEKNKVDVTLKLEEQNRNQLTFGAGVSQFEGLLRPAVVPDRQLPRPRREPHGVAAGRLPGPELPGGLHRAVPVRPQHHRRHRRLQAAAQLHQPVHPVVGWRQPDDGLPGGRLLAAVRQLQLRAHGSAGPERGLHQPAAAAAEPVPGRLAAAASGRVTDDQQDRRRASPSTPSTTRSSRPPAAS